MARTELAEGSAARQRHEAKDSRPKVLVLLAAHNGALWIGEQLRSILEQRDVDIRVVIRDDASVDQTRARIAPFLNSDKVSLTCDDSPSGSAAQNFFALIRENPADGFDFVALADQDDEWCADKLARASNRLRTASGAGYSSATLAIWPDGKSRVLTQPLRTTPSDFLFGGVGQGCTFTLTAEFYARARDFLSRNAILTRNIHYHDWALYALARAWNLPWIFDPVPSVRYRQHDSNDTGAKSTLGGIRKRLRLVRSGWYADQIATIARLCAAANPSSPVIAAWRSMITAPRSWSRRIRIAKFCMRGGRRSAADNCVVLIAAVAGWL